MTLLGIARFGWAGEVGSLPAVWLLLDCYSRFGTMQTQVHCASWLLLSCPPPLTLPQPQAPAGAQVAAQRRGGAAGWCGRHAHARPHRQGVAPHLVWQHLEGSCSCCSKVSHYAGVGLSVAVDCASSWSHCTTAGVCVCQRVSARGRPAGGGRGHEDGAHRSV